MPSRKWAVGTDEGAVIYVRPRPAYPFELEFDDEGDALNAAIATAIERRESAKRSLASLRRQQARAERRQA